MLLLLLLLLQLLVSFCTTSWRYMGETPFLMRRRKCSISLVVLEFPKGLLGTLIQRSMREFKFFSSCSLAGVYFSLAEPWSSSLLKICENSRMNEFAVVSALFKVFVIRWHALNRSSFTSVPGNIWVYLFRTLQQSSTHTIFMVLSLLSSLCFIPCNKSSISENLVDLVRRHPNTSPFSFRVIKTWFYCDTNLLSFPLTAPTFRLILNVWSHDITSALRPFICPSYIWECLSKFVKNIFIRRSLLGKEKIEFS